MHPTTPTSWTLPRLLHMVAAAIDRDEPTVGPWPTNMLAGLSQLMYQHWQTARDPGVEGLIAPDGRASIRSRGETVWEGRVDFQGLWMPELEQWDEWQRAARGEA
jgi:hypothetical protein